MKMIIELTDEIYNEVVDSKPLNMLEEAIQKGVKADEVVKEIENITSNDVEFTHGLIQDGVLRDDVLRVVNKYLK